MRFLPLPIAGAFRIEIDKREDERGFFARTFCADEFRTRGLVSEFVQHSVSFNSRRGTLRGLHYQAPPHAETKLIRCIAGAAFDVIVDLRRHSPSFCQWYGETISAQDRALLYIPAGCAHGFQVLTDNTEIYYEITPSYIAAAARGIAFDDPTLGISWPLPVEIVSSLDAARPKLDQAEMFA